MSKKLYFVEVVDAESNEVIKTLELANLRTAEKVEDGMNINLDHARYFTRVKEVDKP